MLLATMNLSLIELRLPTQIPTKKNLQAWELGAQGAVFGVPTRSVQPQFGVKGPAKP
jgi:hypothetical protein